VRCVCADCGILYNIKEPFDDDSESHGFCELCFEIIMKNFQIEQERGANEDKTG
jgi:hypothetical protein